MHTKGCCSSKSTFSNTLAQTLFKHFKLRLVHKAGNGFLSSLTHALQMPGGQFLEGSTVAIAMRSRAHVDTDQAPDAKECWHATAHGQTHAPPNHDQQHDGSNGSTMSVIHSNDEDLGADGCASPRKQSEVHYPGRAQSIACH